MTAGNKKLINVIRFLAVFIFFITWELVADLKIIQPQFISGPINAILSLTSRDVIFSVLNNSYFTLLEISIAYLLALLIGLGAGLLVGLNKYLTSVFEPYVLLLFSIPKISLLPLFILLFGIGLSSKIAFGMFAGIFPIAVNTIAAAKSINESNVVLARSMGASDLQIYYKIVLPSIIPTAFAGMRLSLVLVAVTVTLAEMYQGTVTGLGSLIFYWSTIFLTGPLYGVILLFSAVLIGINQLLLYFEKRLNMMR